MSCLNIETNYAEFECLARLQELYLLKQETKHEWKTRKKKIDRHKQICSFLRQVIDTGDEGHRRFIAWCEAFEDGTALETAMAECLAMEVAPPPAPEVAPPPAPRAAPPPAPEVAPPPAPEVAPPPAPDEGLALVPEVASTPAPEVASLLESAPPSSAGRSLHLEQSSGSILKLQEDTNTDLQEYVLLPTAAASLQLGAIDGSLRGDPPDASLQLGAIDGSLQGDPPDASL